MATEIEPAATMDTDAIRELKGKLLITFLNPQNSSTNGSLGLTTIPEVNFSTMTLGELTDLIIQDSKCPSATKDGVDILHKAQIITTKMTSTLQHLNLKPNSIIQVVKRFTKTSTEGKDEAEVVAASAVSNDKNFTPEQLHQVSLALRTGFMQPSFAKTIKKLGESEMLDSIIAIAPQLATDTVGLAIIQSPGMIYYYSDLEPMKKLAEERRWVIDAFNFIAAAVHQDKSLSSSGFPRGLLASSLLEGDAEADEEMEEDPAARSGNNTPRPSSGSASRSARPQQPSLFTREHVEQAIRAAFPFNIPQPTGGNPPNAGGGGTNLSDLYRSLQQTVSASQSAGATPSSSASSLTTTAPAVPAQPQQSNPSASAGSISTTDFARAIMDAVNHLPESVRAEQLNLLRHRIQQISDASAGAPAQLQQPSTLTSGQPTTPGSTNASTQPTEYQAELNQMREVGITNERLALQALRVCDGDVSTACDLILSGWNGEGAEEENR